jgi:hypothetical protein
MKSVLHTLGVVALVVAAPVQAQVICKCVEKGKPVSFQTSPCPTTAKVADARAYTPDRELTWAEKRQREAQWATRRPQQAPTAAHIPMPTVTPSSQSHCELARSQREQWERMAGLNRSYDTVRAWNERVARACN